MKTLFSVALCLLCLLGKAQSADPEFPKEFIMHAKLHNGMITSFHRYPELYVGGLQLIPQYTFVPQLLRGGLIGDVYYTANKVQAAVGPTVSFKLKNFNLKPFGSGGNIHINIDHLWGTNKERLLGGGINADILNKLIISLTAHRDYHFKTWWFQNGIAIRISKNKTIIDDINK